MFRDEELAYWEWENINWDLKMAEVRFKRKGSYRPAMAKWTEGKTTDWVTPTTPPIELGYGRGAEQVIRRVAFDIFFLGNAARIGMELGGIGCD